MYKSAPMPPYYLHLWEGLYSMNVTSGGPQGKWFAHGKHQLLAPLGEVSATDALTIVGSLLLLQWHGYHKPVSSNTKNGAKSSLLHTYGYPEWTITTEYLVVSNRLRVIHFHHPTIKAALTNQ